MRHVSKHVRNVGIIFTLLLVLGTTMVFVKTVAAEDLTFPYYDFSQQTQGFLASTP